MKKGLKKLALSLSATLALVLSLTPAFALGSIVSNGQTTGDVLVGGKVVEGATSEFSDDFSYLTDDKIAQEITQLNAGTKLSDALAEEKVKLPEGLDIDLREFSLLTAVQDLTATDKDGNPIEGDVTLTWEVPNLTKEAGEVYVLHYSTKRTTWEVIKPENVDYSAKTVTAHFEDLSPVAVIYKSSEVKPSQGTNTSTATNMGLYVGAAAVALAGIGFVVYKKKNN